MRDDELAAFLDRGVAMLGAVADDGCVPEVFRVWGASIDDAGQVRALASSDAGRTLGALRDGTRVSLTFTDVTNFESVQLKGSATGPAAPPGPADIELMRRYDETFVPKLRSIGHPTRLADRIRPVAVFVITAVVDRRYDQTPGADAGAAVGAG